ncbi:MAG: hypothetical protein WA622_04075, partial [Mycobacterium sp.]|uniref:hypothetical protein n=1 Tax=Mycobacterium sp. TaxID=1785 RepID=UPI003CA654F6
MQRNLRPWVTTGVVLVGASLIAVTPLTAPLPDVQHRQFRLVDYDEYDLSQLTATTEANWSGLETAVSSSNWTTDPDISQGLSTLFSDLSTGTANPVTNPTALLTEGALLLTSSADASNAASTALTAVTDNVESALSGGDYSAALTDLENGPTTVLDAYLNGYPETVGSGGLISPEFGLLTNTTDGAATGQIDALAQVSNTVADEVANLGGANLTTGSLPEVTGTVDFSVSLNQILSDLGLTSGGATLTVNGLLSDLGLSSTSSILPTDISLGTVLSDVGLSSSSGIDVGQVLGDLNLSDGSAISLGTVLGDLGLSSSSGIDVGAILGDLNLSDGSGISLGTILGDLGLSTSSGIDVGAILGDLGLSDSSSISIPAISVGTILNDLGLSDSSSISIPAISVGTILNDLGISDSSSISLGQVLTELGLSDSTSITPPSLSIPVDTILSDLGVTNTSGDLTFGVPSVSLGTILGDLGINT